MKNIKKEINKSIRKKNREALKAAGGYDGRYSTKVIPSKKKYKRKRYDEI